MEPIAEDAAAFISQKEDQLLREELLEAVANGPLPKPVVNDVVILLA